LSATLKKRSSRSLFDPTRKEVIRYEKK